MKTYNSWKITDPRTFDEAKTMIPKIFIVQPAEVPVQFYGLQSLEFETLGEDKALTHVGQVFKLIHSHLLGPIERINSVSKIGSSGRTKLYRL